MATKKKSSNATPTRTFNPLHMEDLDPRRFEDLVRQLIHGFRDWRLIEATGRLGNDEGVDVRAEEETVAVPSDDGDDAVGASETREWRIQCKRYKRLHPKAVAAIVDELVPDPDSVPYGVIIAAAADVSADALSAFHSRALALGVVEHHFWSRSVLEDLLYRPENDHLLFAYFGISLQARRRSITATIRAAVGMKKQLRALFEKEDDDTADRYLLLRDPNDERYPQKPKLGEPHEQWVLVQYFTLKRPGRLVVLVHEHPAWLTPDRRGWDALFSDDIVPSSGAAHLRSLNAWGARDDNVGDSNRPNHAFWAEYVPEPDKAWMKVARAIRLERIIALDPIGDGFFPVPHVFLDFHEKDGPFEKDVSFRWFEARRYPAPLANIELRPDADKHIRLFPETIPQPLDPIPAAFDSGTYPAPPLTDLAVPKLETILDKVESGRQAIKAKREGAKPPAGVEELSAPFRTWRDSIALQTFSAFSERLRAAGGSARVVVRSAPTTADQSASESVELKISILVGSLYNPDYRPTGYVRATWSFNRGFEFEVWPRPEEEASGRTYPARQSKPEAPTLEQLTKVRLEQEVLGVLGRMSAER